MKVTAWHTAGPEGLRSGIRSALRASLQPPLRPSGLAVSPAVTFNAAFSYQHGSPTYQQNVQLSARKSELSAKSHYQPKKVAICIVSELLKTIYNFWKLLETSGNLSKLSWKFPETSKQFAEDGNFQPLVSS